MKKQRDLKRICTINMSGFLSVMVVLLFALMAPYLSYVDLPNYYPTLPVAQHPTPQSKAIREDAMYLNIMRDGTVYFLQYGHATKIPNDQLAARIREAVRKGSERKVYIEADQHARYQN